MGLLIISTSSFSEHGTNFRICEIASYIIGALVLLTALFLHYPSKWPWPFVLMVAVPLIMLIPKFVIGRRVEKGAYEDAYKPLRLMVICQWVMVLVVSFCTWTVMGEVYDAALLDMYRNDSAALVFIAIALIVALVSTIAYIPVLRAHLSSEGVQSKAFAVNIKGLVNMIDEAVGNPPTYTKADIKNAKKEAN